MSLQKVHDLEPPVGDTRRVWSAQGYRALLSEQPSGGNGAQNQAQATRLIQARLADEGA